MLMQFVAFHHWLTHTHTQLQPQINVHESACTLKNWPMLSQTNSPEMRYLLRVALSWQKGARGEVAACKLITDANQSSHAAHASSKARLQQKQSASKREGSSEEENESHRDPVSCTGAGSKAEIWRTRSTYPFYQRAGKVAPRHTVTRLMSTGCCGGGGGSIRTTGRPVYGSERGAGGWRHGRS